jgi:hypothetical protein
LLVAILLDEYSIIKTPCPMDAFVGQGDTPDPIYESIVGWGVTNGIRAWFSFSGPYLMEIVFLKFMILE